MTYIKNISIANLEVCEKADTFLQSAMWGEFKSRFGWVTKAFLVEWQQNDSTETFPLLVLSRQLAPAFGFTYIPWGPQLPLSFSPDERPTALAQLAQKLKPFLPYNIVFVRFEPPWFVSKEEVESRKEEKRFGTVGFKHSAATVQPPDTVLINLEASSKEILTQMKSKWRYNISLAGKKGVLVKTATIDELDKFYALLSETAKRDGIAVHSFIYYKTLFELCNQSNIHQNNMQLRLYLASHEDDILAAIVVLFRGKDATYLYGASSNIKRNLMAPYALQWKAMLDVKEIGCKNYDLFGIPPNDDPAHPMAGLYLFKTGFGGQIVHRPGTWDYPYKPLFYTLFNIAEKLRKKLMNRKKFR